MIRTPKNITTRTRTRESNPAKLVSITESTGITSQSEDQNDSMKIPPPNEMFLLNPQCEKSISQEVQFYFKSYQEFITSSNQKLIAVMSALNAMNIGHYDDLRIKYPGFILEPPVNMHTTTNKTQTRPGTDELAPVAYFSENFDKTQVKWNITEKDAYAIYKSVKRFAFYITGAKTTVFSDHKLHRNFFEEGMNIAKLDRWSLELQEFDISLEFIQGKLNKIADVTSRLKNEGLYTKHSNEKPVNEKIDEQDRIEVILDKATNSLNFKRVFNTSQVISIKELLQGQKRDKFWR